MIRPITSWVDYSFGRYGSIIALCDNGQIYQLHMSMKDGLSTVEGSVWIPIGPPLPGTDAYYAQQQEK